MVVRKEAWRLATVLANEMLWQDHNHPRVNLPGLWRVIIIGGGLNSHLAPVCWKNFGTVIRCVCAIPGGLADDVR